MGTQSNQCPTTIVESQRSKMMLCAETTTNDRQTKFCMHNSDRFPANYPTKGIIILKGIIDIIVSDMELFSVFLHSPTSLHALFIQRE